MKAITLFEKTSFNNIMYFNMSKLIFVSSPYGHPNPDVVEENYLKVTKFVSQLCSNGQVAISPITYGHTLLKYKKMPSDWEFWKNFCVTLLTKCDEMIVYKMDGWDKSNGVAEEIRVATNLGIKIKYVDMNNTDEYLVPGKSGQRLIDEYNKYGSLTIGVDFDGTLYDYHGTGATYEQVIELLRELNSIGCKIICWTAQKDLSFVETYLNENNIPFDGINTDGIKLGWESRKPFFSALLDDRAGLLQVYNELCEVIKDKRHLEYIRVLNSGLFFEFHSDLTGIWENDCEQWLKIRKFKK